MRKTDSAPSATPAIQVIERMFGLIDVLASREEAVSLKEISEKTGLHPSTAHRILNDLALGRFVDRPEAGSYRCWSWATWSKPGSMCAMRHSTPCVICTGKSTNPST
jgi:hypothetical protein